MTYLRKIIKVVATIRLYKSERVI